MALIPRLERGHIIKSFQLKQPFNLTSHFAQGKVFPFFSPMTPEPTARGRLNAVWHFHQEYWWLHCKCNCNFTQKREHNSVQMTSVHIVVVPAMLEYFNVQYLMVTCHAAQLSETMLNIAYYM